MRRRTIAIDQLDELVTDRQPERAPSEGPTSRQDFAGGLDSVPPRLRTEFEFELPRGYVDQDGQVHRHGVMRLATARDELRPQIDLRVKENPGYLSVVLLSQVITRLGSVPEVHAGVVEQMYATDIAFLQDFYRRINSEGHTRAGVACPSCGAAFEVDLAGGRLGES
ncbi:hypothetical protein KCV87_05295 [Actinosynnema pretiosum subsp. pretiosum]|uniref:Secreted protein n=1 Tax=Actinosynnema pretiosum subsp. pretiosum TaxID=103721 RepID=A0AA45L8Y9_9PSEU|nr:secreted protein [Actinosynnema pretiosum subsp. pretiosum]QUF05516.1 hypothetical protein KCV87_05295 [Actinosynnema pretiosum subsp. pretiosum]